MEEFKPINPNEVRMYTCGPTVWDYPHIGNYRTFLFEDFLRRFLKYKGFNVKQVMNLTDVDDRIIKVSRETGMNLRDFTQKYIDAFFSDLDFLRVERAEVYPRATQHIDEMVRIIARLIELGYAYRGEDGSIYYKISKFQDYGKLSGLKVSELKPGARVRQDDYTKESAQDFALWKAWDPGDGDVFWETELGRGRPGWHIECSAMSMKYLGESFDIHTGGVDLIFPHHENEIAQSEAYSGKKFANYWLHSEHLLVGGEKMSKRLGNIVTMEDLRRKGFEGSEIRFLLLSAHYRTQLNFTEQSLEQARMTVKRINGFVSRLKAAISDSHKKRNNADSTLFSSTKESEQVRNLVEETRSKYISALENDLDSPRALAAFFEFISSSNKLLDLGADLNERDLRLMLDFVLDDFDRLFAVIDTSFLSGEESETALTEEAELLLKQREEARKNRNWELSDFLRERLADLGFEVQDTAQGQKWRRVKTKKGA
jgi:cysteinyl-tRNA synthetase